MHPPRTNQYKFTEVAPFPEIYFPFEIGKSWESNLNIQRGWGEWSDTYGSSEYVVHGTDDFLINEQVITCWIIKAKSTFPFGVSYAEFWFHEDYGFVKLNYVNYKEEVLDLKLIAVEESL